MLNRLWKGYIWFCLELRDAISCHMIFITDYIDMLWLMQLFVLRKDQSYYIVSVLRAFNFLHLSLKLDIIDTTNIWWKFVLQAVFSLSVFSKKDRSHEITVCRRITYCTSWWVWYFLQVNFLSCLFDTDGLILSAWSSRMERINWTSDWASSCMFSVYFRRLIFISLISVS